MKKRVIFVLYVRHFTSVTYLAGLSHFSRVEKVLHETLDDDYQISFNYEEADADSGDCLVVPDPLPLFVNRTGIPELKISAQAFHRMDMDTIKTAIDHYFAQQD